MLQLPITHEKPSGCASMWCHSNAFSRCNLHIVRNGTQRFSDHHREDMSNMSVTREKHFECASVSYHMLRPGDKDQEITFNIADLLTGRIRFWWEVFIPEIARTLGKILKNSRKVIKY